MDRLDATALVDRDVYHHRTRPHGAHHVIGDERRCASTRNQDGPDHHVGLGHRTLKRSTVGRQGGDPAAVDLVDPTEPVDVDVEQPDLGLHAGGDPRRVPSHIAGAHDHHPRRLHTRCAAHEHTAPAVGRLQQVGGDLDRHATGHLAHGRQEGQRAVRLLDGLVCDPGGT